MSETRHGPLAPDESATGAIKAEVLIVGMGPVGMLLAIQLGQRGHNVVVVDRNVTGYPRPRAVTHCSEVARILQSIGLAPDTIADITEPYDGTYSWLNGAGEVLLEVDWGGYGESGWHNTYFFHQPDLERAFERALADLPSVTTIRGWQAMSLEQSREGATTVIESIDTGERISVEADWVVGADGANSTVRGLLDVGWRDDGYFHDWLVVDAKLLDPAMNFPRVAVQHCTPERPTTMVPAGPGRRRWEFMRLSHEAPAHLEDADTIWKLLSHYGIGPDDAELERHSIYTFQACSASEWRCGRVFLAGDAAHLMPPFAGQGLSAGLRDANNLCWKLSAVLRGVAAESLLDTYGSERQHHALAYIEFSTELGRVICVTDPRDAAIRDQRLLQRRRDRPRPLVPPRPGLGTGLHTGQHGGTLAHQGRVRCVAANSVGLFDDVFGGAGAVITRVADTLDALDSGARTALRALEIDVVALAGPRDDPDLIDDMDGVYARWLDQLAVDTVLIRPDFHLYGCATADDTADLVHGFLAATGLSQMVDVSGCGRR